MNRCLRAALLLFVVSPTPGLCWDAAAVLPPGETAGPALAERVRLLPDGGAWVEGWNGELVRLIGGRAIRAQHESWFGVQRTAYLADTTSDGGALVNADCTLVRYTSEGRMRWRREQPCDTIVVAASDETAWGSRVPWNPSSEPPLLSHLAADGTTLPIPAETQQHVAPYPVNEGQPLFRAADGGVLHVGAVRTGAGLNQVRVLRIDAQGHIRWQWQSSEGGWITPLAAATADGGVLVSGCVAASDGNTCGVPQIVRLAADGQVRWFNRALPMALFVSAPIAMRDGGAAILMGARTTDERVVVRLAPDGRIAWEKPVGALFNWPFVVEAADGGVIVAGVGPLSLDQRGLRFVSLDTAGRTRTDRYLSPGKPMVDGNTLLLANATPPRLARIDERGERIPIDNADVGVATEMDHAASASGSDGSEFVLAIDRHASHDRPTPHFTLTKVGADGRIAWQRDTADEVVSAALGANAERVCSVTRRARITAQGFGASIGIVECFEAATGATLWSREITSRLVGAHALTVLPDSRLVVAYGSEMSHFVDVLDTSGRSQRSTNGYLSPLQIATSPNGHMAMSLNPDTSSTDRIAVYGPDAQRRYVISGSALNFGHSPRALAVSDEGAVAAYGLDASSDFPANTVVGAIYSTDPAVPRSWRSALPPLQDNGWFATLAFAGNSLLVAQRREHEDNDTSPDMRTAVTRLSALDRAGGSVRWQQDSPHVGSLRHAMAASADGNRVVSVHGDRRRLHVAQFDRRSGERMFEGWRDCAALECDPVRLVNGSDGVSRLVARVQTAEHGSGVAVYTQRAFDVPPIPTRLDQPGIAGAWWSPYANGEGVLFDWLPASRTLFAAWFTYSNAGGNEPSELRWYTLQANGVGGAATSLELPILETTGGNFGAPPAVSPQRVGTAKVSFSDCRNGTLDYAFDPGHNDARRGTITLSRLSPATEACVLADGRTVPGADARPPANGFDARMSGTWFDEATPGQGLQFTVQPGGVFFAPWFTFDPADTGNDAGRQHWFTLQGNLAQANNGTVELVLVQTLGGRFDREPTWNAQAIGAATLVMLACDRARLDYRFDATPQAGPYAARSGSLALSKAGGCAP